MNPPWANFFDAANAHELCAASAEAYGTPASAGPDVLWSEAGDTRVLITRVGHDLIVAFRGTADLGNWLTDLDCEFVRAGDCRVHRGFHEAVRLVESDVFARLSVRHGERIWVTGHSLGGALGMLWAMRADQLGLGIAGVYTFGQPRVGDGAFSQLYNSRLKARTWRFVHADDIVPRVPWQLGRYRHAGHEVYLGGMSWKSGRKDDASYVIDPSIPARLPGGLYHAVRELCRGRIAMLADHHIDTYLSYFRESIPLAARAAAFS